MPDRIAAATSNMDNLSQNTFNRVLRIMMQLPECDLAKDSTMNQEDAVGFMFNSAELELRRQAAEEIDSERTIFGLDYIDSNESLEASWYFQHGLRNIQKEVRQYIKGGVAIDAGAWRGDSALMMLKKLGVSRVYSFDLCEVNRAYYKRLMEYNGVPSSKAQFVVSGLYHKKEAAWVDCSDAWEAVASLKQTQNGTQVILDSLDSMDYITEPIKFVKLNVEGAGVQAFLGMTKLLQRHRPVIAAHVEHSPQEMFELKPLIEQRLAGYRFEFRRISFGLGAMRGLVLLAYPEEALVTPDKEL